MLLNPGAVTVLTTSPPDTVCGGAVTGIVIVIGMLEGRAVGAVVTVMVVALPDAKTVVTLWSRSLLSMLGLPASAQSCMRRWRFRLAGSVKLPVGKRRLHTGSGMRQVGVTVTVEMESIVVERLRVSVMVLF